MTIMAATKWADLPERFRSKVEVMPNRCWEWTAYRNPNGYGQYRVGSVRDGTRRQVGAHRFAYETLVGPVPAGRELDHLCRNPPCVNPAHLEPVTHRENMLRGETVGARASRATHCPQGHPYDEANTRRNPDGSRGCRQCGLAVMRSWFARQPSVPCATCGKGIKAPNMKKHTDNIHGGQT